MPVHFNKPNVINRDRRLDDVGEAGVKQVDSKKAENLDGKVDVKKAEDLDPGMATSDVKAVVGDATSGSRPNRRSAGSRGGVAGMSHVQSSPKKNKGTPVWKKAVMAAMIGIMALGMVGCGDSSPDPGPPGGGVRVEQQYDGDVSNPLEGRPARGSPMQIQMDNMSGGDRDVRTDDGGGGVPNMPAPNQNVHPDADRGATLGSADVQGEIERRVDVEVRTGYVNQDKQANLGRGQARIQQQQGGGDVQQQQDVEVERRGGGMTDAERLELENSGGDEVRRDTRTQNDDNGGREVRTRNVRTRDVQTRDVQTRDVQTRDVRTQDNGGGGVTFHRSGGSK